MAYKTLLKMWWVRMKTKQRKLPTNEAQRGKETKKKKIPISILFKKAL